MTPEKSPLSAELARAIAAGMPKCPNCGGQNVRRSERRRFEDKVLALVGYSPFRCRTCQTRFYRRWKAHPAAPGARGKG